MFRRFVVVVAIVVLTLWTPTEVESGQARSSGDGAVRTYEARDRTWGELLSIWLTVEMDTAAKAG